MPLMLHRPGRLLLAASLVALLAGCVPSTSVTPVAPSATGEARQFSQRDSYLRMADSARASGDHAGAAGLYRQAISLDPERPDGYVRLGETLLAMEAYEDAAQAFRDAQRLQPTDRGARRGYARALVGMNRPEAAIPHYEAVLAADPGDLRAHNGLGVAYDLSGRHEEAQEVYRQGLAIAPDSTQLLNNLGLSLALAGRHDQAIGTLRQVADSRGSTPRHRQNLALAYGLAGNLAAAEAVARLDLDEESVQNNLRYYAALRAGGDGRRQAASIGTHPPQAPQPVRAEQAAQRLQAVALQGEGLELGIVRGGSWFLDLGQFAGSAAAQSAWRQLRGRHADMLGPLTRLAGVEEGRQPLLVGPLGDKETAERVCRELEARGQSCRPVGL